MMEISGCEICVMCWQESVKVSTSPVKILRKEEAMFFFSDQVTGWAYQQSLEMVQKVAIIFQNRAITKGFNITQQKHAQGHITHILNQGTAKAVCRELPHLMLIMLTKFHYNPFKTKVFQGTCMSPDKAWQHVKFDKQIWSLCTILLMELTHQILHNLVLQQPSGDS